MAAFECPWCGARNIQGSDECSECGLALSNIGLPGAGPVFVRAPLSNLPQRAPAKVGPTDPVGLAVSLMQREGTDCVLVVEGDDLAGIITSWDILHKVAGPKEDLNAVTCAQIMTRDPVVLREDDNLAVALNKMAIGAFRHIPLVANGKPVSLVSVTEVFRYLSPHLV